MRDEKNFKLLVVTIACVVVPFVMFKVMAPALDRFVANPFVDRFIKQLIFTILSIIGVTIINKAKELKYKLAEV